MRVVSFAIVCAICGPGARSFACSVDGPPPHQFVTNPADQTPPETPMVSVVKTELGKHGACAGGGNCRDLSIVKFHVQSRDDLSPADKVGYVLLADEFHSYNPVPEPVRADPSGNISVYTFGREWEDKVFDVQVFAVDEAGNVSEEPAVVTVDFSDRCQLASDFVEGSTWTLALLALLLRSRRNGARIATA